jgi:hypothetical protein
VCAQSNLAIRLFDFRRLIVLTTNNTKKQEPAPATVTPVSSADASSSKTNSSTSRVPSTAARLNLTGNAKPPSGTEALLNAASGASQVSDKLKQALEENPSLINVVDDKLFFKDKQLSPDLQCFPMNADELEIAIEVSPSSMCAGLLTCCQLSWSVL